MISKSVSFPRLLSKLSLNQQILRHSSAFKFYQFLKEKQPYDIDYFEGGEQVIKPHEPKRTSFIESKDPTEWKAVQNILPPNTIPSPPTHASYPTSSGWFPPKEASLDEAYRVRRTKFHNFPLYFKILNGGNRKFTVVKRVMGDIKKFEEDLKLFLEKETNQKVYTMVNEVCCKVWVKGTHMDNIGKFLTLKGF